MIEWKDKINPVDITSKPEDEEPSDKKESTQQYVIELPKKIQLLLEISSGTSNNACIEHTSFRELLHQG